MENTTIIYNKLNLSAVIAAAIVMTEMNVTNVSDVSQLVDDEFDTYIWIGVNPKKNIGEFYFRTKSKEHIIITEAERPISALEILNPFMKIQRPEVGDDDHCALSFKPTLIDLVCKHFEIDNYDYRKLDFHTARFYERSTEVEFLAYVYANLVQANECIVNRTNFLPKASACSSVTDYLNDVRKVKQNFTSHYKKTVVLDGDKVKSAIHTSVSDFSFHLTLRLTRLVHRNFLNMTMGMSGAIAYTNMRQIKFSNANERPLVLN